jgi:hypothetical protein
MAFAFRRDGGPLIIQAIRIKVFIKIVPIERISLVHLPKVIKKPQILATGSIPFFCYLEYTIQFFKAQSISTRSF